MLRRFGTLSTGRTSLHDTTLQSGVELPGHTILYKCHVYTVTYSISHATTPLEIFKLVA